MKDDFFNPPNDKNVHLVWHKFERKFKNDLDRYNQKGYPLSKAIEKWAKKYP